MSRFDRFEAEMGLSAEMAEQRMRAVGRICWRERETFWVRARWK